MGWIKGKRRPGHGDARLTWRDEAILVNGRLELPHPVKVKHGAHSTYVNWGCRCQACHAANLARDQKRKPEVDHASYVRRAYGITAADEQRMFVEQEGRCKVCLESFAQGEHPHIDHEHVSKIVRGLLHSACNTGIGQLGDSPTVLRRAARYVESRGTMPYEPGIGEGLV